MVICCTTNEKYVKFTLALINSIRKNCKIKYKVECLCVNVSKESVKKIKNLGNVNCIIDNTLLSKKRTLTTPDNSTLTSIFNRDKDYGCLVSEEACYCSNKRFDLVYNTLLKNDYVLFLDVDAIIRKDLNELFLRYKNFDITIKKNINSTIYGTRKVLKISEPNNIIYQQGVFFVKSNTKTINFYNSLKRIVEKDIFNWNIDQIAFYNEIEKHNLNLYQLDTTFKDVYNRPDDFKDTSHIWSGAWKEKYSNEKYLTEFSKYAIE
tara:strand:+ start:7603 stop:8394 length:792 start_codon:yes stop_codon:yes gene_type:complete